MTGIRRAVTALRHAVEWTAGILLAPFVALPALLALMAAWPAFLLFVPSMAIARTVAFFAGESVQSGDGTSPAARRQATFGAAVPAAA
ncbi:MAG: hypothetical protein D6705_15745 [Deltaproteobacteria bacterium]|nr:MAG: hypothetical protein D6705_15745 [Deltaproteobacteria bacterium]